MVVLRNVKIVEDSIAKIEAVHDNFDYISRFFSLVFVD